MSLESRLKAIEDQLARMMPMSRDDGPAIDVDDMLARAILGEPDVPADIRAAVRAFYGDDELRGWAKSRRGLGLNG